MTFKASRPLRNPRTWKHDGGDGAAGSVPARTWERVERKRRAIMARYGRVTFSISYVVDLDDAEMVDEARVLVAEDVAAALRHTELDAWIDVEKDRDATEGDIIDYLIESRDERAAV